MSNQWDTLGRTFLTSCVTVVTNIPVHTCNIYRVSFGVKCHVLCCKTDLIPLQDARLANLALGVGPEERFFNKLEDDVSRIIQQEKRREQYSNSQGQEVNTSTEHEPVSRPIETHV